MLFAAAASANPQEDFLCEDSPLDIYPDVYFHCEAMQSFKKGFDEHALELLQRASLWGSKTAQYKVGLMYLGGVGTQADPVEGAAWLLLANERNNRKVTERLAEVLDKLSDSSVMAANSRAAELRETYGDLEALERRADWVRRMKKRTTGSRLGKPMATVVNSGTSGITGDQALNRLDHYEQVLREAVTTVEYRDFRVLEPEEESSEDRP
ncbi:MAG: hypothetical protein R3200_07420 [Xanthomonadales bacterium]|nr:hypothetical protein [Xanthomonadales bacterium]